MINNTTVETLEDDHGLNTDSNETLDVDDHGLIRDTMKHGLIRDT